MSSLTTIMCTDATRYMTSSKISLLRFDYRSPLAQPAAKRICIHHEGPVEANNVQDEIIPIHPAPPHAYSPMPGSKSSALTTASTLASLATPGFSPTVAASQDPQLCIPTTLVTTLQEKSTVVPNSSSPIATTTTSTPTEPELSETDLSSFSRLTVTNTELNKPKSTNTKNRKRKRQNLFCVSSPTDPAKVVIGPNGTELSKETYEQIPWPNVTINNINEILVDVFGEETLATHSFADQPILVHNHLATKPPLHPEAVADLISLIRRKSIFSSKYIKVLIAAKCSHEGHMKEMRECGEENVDGA